MSLPTFHMVKEAPDPVAPFSHAVETGSWVFVTGQLPFTGSSKTSPYPEGIEAQTRQVMDNLKAALALAGATFDDVCKCTCWLQDARDFGAFNRVYMSYFPNGRPARSTTEARLMVDAKVEIDVIAYKPRG